jgi:hypothetical protein
MTHESWLAELHQAARGSAQRGIETLRGARPPLANATSAGALSSLLLAAFVVGAAAFRTRVAPLPFDLIASALRTLALAFAARALFSLARTLLQLRADAAAPDAALVLSERGLLLQAGVQQSWTPRHEILGVTFQEALPSRSLAPRAAPLLLVLTPREGAPRYLTIPPFFAPSTQILQARLLRWLEHGQPAPAAAPVPPPPDPERRYLRAARGQLETGMLVVPEGRGYLLRAPFTALLGVVFALDILRTAGAARAQVATPLLAACLLTVSVLVAWFVWLRRRRATRLGIGMLLTPEELLMRGRAGVVSVPWSQLTEVSVQTTARWSPFVGAYPARALQLGTQEGQRIVFDASFLGIPAEVVALLCRAYRDGSASRAGNSQSLDAGV